MFLFEQSVVFLIIRLKFTLFCQKLIIVSKITVLATKIKVAKQSLFLLFFTTKYNGRFYKKNQSAVDCVKKDQFKTDNFQKKTLNRLKLEKISKK